MLSMSPRDIHPLAIRDAVSDAAAAWLKNRLPKAAGLCADTRRLQSGDAFLARSGQKVAAQDNIAKAVIAGAAAVLLDAHADEGLPVEVKGQVPTLAVPHLAKRMGMIASAFYDRPSMALQLFAVTGTNGKSSVTTSLAYAMARSGICSAAIGTLGMAIFPAHCAKDFSPQWNTEITGGLTTPDAVDLQRVLSALKAQGVRVVTIEASSVGLLQGRLQGCMIKTAVFTNLSHDHLDLHGSMQAYAKAKALLFESQTLGAVVINTDDAYGMTMWDAVMVHADRIAVGSTLPKNAYAGFAAINAQAELNGWTIQIEGRGKAAAVSGTVHLPVVGRHNIDNALTVAACLFLQDFDPAEIHARLSEFHLPAGRLQMIHEPQSPWVCIDYAHSPDALMRALEGLRLVAEQRAGRLICIFGCGGDRDTAKRPLMGEIATRLSDQVVLTSDNPRTESPEAILRDIARGIPAALATKVTQIVDREAAIKQTVMQARPEDLILVAGKGHESLQHLADRTIPFSDADQARTAIHQWLESHDPTVPPTSAVQSDPAFVSGVHRA